MRLPSDINNNLNKKNNAKSKDKLRCKEEIFLHWYR
jgi:hypothetical protein